MARKLLHCVVLYLFLIIVIIRVEVKCTTFPVCSLLLDCPWGNFSGGSVNRDKFFHPILALMVDLAWTVKAIPPKPILCLICFVVWSHKSDCLHNILTKQKGTSVILTLMDESAVTTSFHLNAPCQHRTFESVNQTLILESDWVVVLLLATQKKDPQF